jgi:hypothetical protein
MRTTSRFKGKIFVVQAVTKRHYRLTTVERAPKPSGFFTNDPHVAKPLPEISQN